MFALGAGSGGGEFEARAVAGLADSEADGDALAQDLQAAGETVVSLGDVVVGERGVEWVEGR